MTSRSTEWLNRWIVPVGLFGLALATRLPALGKFLTPDEFLWVDRSRNFLAGLLNTGFVCKSLVEQTGFSHAEGLACTLRTGHPGVTTMWTGSLGILLRYLADGSPGSLFDYTVGLATNPLDARLIVPERLPSVVFISLSIAVMAWLVGQLFEDRWVGLTAGLLVALDPFHTALSRVIHHDALAATFMTLALLTALMYWTRHRSRRWLIVSGICGGLAFLSKSSSLFLNPFILVLAAWSLVDHFSRTGRLSWRSSRALRGRTLLVTVGDGLLWLACAVITFCAVWPAMWVLPVDAVRTIFTVGLKYASGGHAKGNYFLGAVSNDPGTFFYPVTWLLRSSPLVWAGLAAVVGVAVSRLRGSEVPLPSAVLVGPQGGGAPSEGVRETFLPDAESGGRSRAGILSRLGIVAGGCPRSLHGGRRASTAPILWLLLVYALLFLVFMTFGEKKQDRYILPIYPAITMVAAAGLVDLVKLAQRHVGGRRAVVPGPCTGMVLRFAPQILLVVILLFQGYLIAAHFPYYFTYYNPLLGGIRSAERLVTIGWGEGLDLAAEYLNQKAGAEQLRVAAWYQSTFAPFFKGKAISYSQEKGKALSGNYVVFYINQLQRRFPDEELFRYFEDRYEPEAVIPLHGITYAVIYPAPGMQHYVEDRVDENRRNYRGIAALLGWDWPDTEDPDHPTVASGDALSIRLFWEYLGKQPEEKFFFRLLDDQDLPVAEGISQPAIDENGDPTGWRDGQIIAETGSLSVPLDTPPGDYQLQIGFYTQAPAVTTGELIFELPENDAHVRVTTPQQGG
jgi:4-amino-4-deoxy-L-arabinose transferase-like glycosyltransferase